MASATCDKTRRSYAGAEGPAIPGLELEVGHGEFMALVGPSGRDASTFPKRTYLRGGRSRPQRAAFAELLDRRPELRAVSFASLLDEIARWSA